MSKHSMMAGGSARPRASCSVVMSSVGRTVVTNCRAKRLVGRVVRLKSSRRLRISAARSKSSRAAAVFHFLFEFGEHFARRAVEKIAGLLYFREIAGAGDFVHARRGAILDDVLEAMAEIDLTGDFGTAGADMEFFAEQAERLAQRAGMGERAEVARAIVLLHAGEREARERVVEVDLDEEEPLVVAED